MVSTTLFEAWAGEPRSRRGFRQVLATSGGETPPFGHCLAETSSFDLLCGIGHRGDNHDTHDPRIWRGNNLLEQALSTVHALLRHSTAGSAHTSFPPHVCTPISSEEVHEIDPAALPHLRVSARACADPPSEFSTYFFDALTDHSADVLAITPCVVRDLAEASCLRLTGGALTEAPFRSMALLYLPPKLPSTVALPLSRLLMWRVFGHRLPSNFHRSRRLGEDYIGWSGHRPF